MAIEKIPSLEAQREHERADNEASDQDTLPPVAKTALEKERDADARDGALENPSYIRFEQLDDLVDRLVLILDPHRSSNTDDPLMKRGRIEKDSRGQMCVVIDRQAYFPYYTGLRQASFPIETQEDIDKLEMTLLDTKNTDVKDTP